jgi:hypothetical protein
VAIGSITRDEFQAKIGFVLPQTAPIQEQGWFADMTNAFLGTIVLDKTDDDWGYIILARDQYFQFRAVAWGSSLPTRAEAHSALVRRMLEFRSSPQRIFPQDEAQEEDE